MAALSSGSEMIRDLVPFLSQDRLTVEDVTGRVGPVAQDPGGLMSIELDPVISGLETARLARYPDSGLPYLLELEFSPDSRPTVASLKPFLGDYRQARTDRGRPLEVMFYPPAGGSRWNVVVIGTVPEGTGRLDDAPVTNVALRRDPQ